MQFFIGFKKIKLEFQALFFENGLKGTKFCRYLNLQLGKKTFCRYLIL